MTAQKLVKFSLEGSTDFPIYEAIDIHPQRWNGWLVPIVSFETAQKIADDINTGNEDDNEVYEQILDCIVEAKENLEDAVDVGCGICWLEVVGE